MMPIYEYKCARCATVFELLRGRCAADKPANCPDCGCKKSQRMLSVFSARINSKSSGSSAVGGSSGCSHCSASSCASCRH